MLTGVRCPCVGPRMTFAAAVPGMKLVLFGLTVSSSWGNGRP